MDEKLKPCPFCGGPAGVNEIRARHAFTAYCAGGNRECPVMVETAGYETRERAIAAWNTRSLSQETNSPLRMFIALRLMRAWNNGTEGFDGMLVKTINDWIDGGMKGSIPWVENPFFEEWAKDKGYSRVDDSIGFRAMATLTNR